MGHSFVDDTLAKIAYNNGMNNIDTLQKFALACRNLTGDEIYELYESRSDRLKDVILNYGTGPNTDPEPVRYALNYLGMMYNVMSLQNY